MTITETIIESLKVIANYSFINNTCGFSEDSYEAEDSLYYEHKAIAEAFFKPTIVAMENALVTEEDMLHFDFKQELGYAIYMAEKPYYASIKYQAENPNWKEDQEDEEIWCTMLDVNDWLKFFMENGYMAEFSHMLGASGNQYPMAKHMMANKPHVAKAVAQAVCTHNKLLMKAKVQPTVATYTIGDVF